MPSVERRMTRAEQQNLLRLGKNLLYVAMPERREHSELSRHDAVRRYWPRGVAS